MTVKNAMAAADRALNTSHPVEIQDALTELLEEVEDFTTAIEDYDEWQLLPGGDPGFYLNKLRVMLGYDEEGR